MTIGSIGHMAQDPSPDTVTEAVSFLASQGYVDDFEIDPRGLACAGVGSIHSLEGAVVDYTFRFEGPSDPADEAIVLGVSCPEWGRKGVIVSAYGPYADSEHIAVLNALAGSRPAPDG